MSVPLNHKLKTSVATGMVAKSTKKAGSKLVKELRTLHADVRETAIQHWNNCVPELVDRDRQIALLTGRALSPATFHNNSVRKDKNEASAEFGRVTWAISNRDQTYLNGLGQLWAACLNEWGTSGVLESRYFNSWHPELYMVRTFTDVPFHNFGSSHLERQAADIMNMPEHYVAFHQAMCSLHDRIVAVLHKLQAILLQSVNALSELQADMAPIKNSGKLLELFPEALHYLPEGFATPKTKQLADPSAINEIRAKLAAGLPV